MDTYTVAVLVYAGVLAAVGISKGRKAKTQEDFMVAGRGASALFLAGTLTCTWIGSGSLFAGAGLAFREGFSALWLSAGAWAGIAVVYFLAPRVRRIAQYTVSDILERRYNALARLCASLTIIVAYVTIAGYQFRGGGRLLHILTGVEPRLGGAIVCACVITFTATAGLISVISIDLFNGAVMTVGILLALPLALTATGGLERLAELPSTHFEIFGNNDPVWALGVFFPTFLLLLGESSIYQKFFAARDERAARRAVVGMILGVILVETAIVALAVIGSARYLGTAPFTGPDGVIKEPATETIILHMARSDLPLVAGVLLLCAAVAIILSTANTFLIVPSTNIARDIYQRFVNPSASQSRVIAVQRLSIVVLGVTAFVVASFFESILDMAFTAYTMVGAGITPALLAAILWKRVTVSGGIASIATGMGITLVITILNIVLSKPLLESSYIILPAALGSIAALVVVSLLTRPQPQERWLE